MVPLLLRRLRRARAAWWSLDEGQFEVVQMLQASSEGLSFHGWGLFS